MSAWSSIVARVVAQMAAVPNVGAVHDSLRLALSEEDFYSWARVDVGGEPRIRAWTVSVEDVETAWLTHDGGVTWNRRASIRGHFQLEDGNDSETGAMAVAEAVCAALDSDIRATKLGSTVSHGGPCRILRNGPALIGFVLCHLIEVELPLLTMEDR